jgi:alpha-tubulin suppressor-like RCC1 family protein
MEDHTVRCWGRNESGELGDGTRTNRRVATKVKNLSGVTQVEIGLNTTCAVIDDGTLRCWGYNGIGLLRDGSNNDRYTPTVPQGVADVVKVSLGDSQACVRRSNDRLDCWSQVEHSGVGGVSDVADVVDIEAGFFMTTAWLRDGSTRQWGKPVPVIPVQSRIKRVASGYYHACVLADTGRVYCSGSGAGDGQNGESEGDDSHVRGISDAIDLAAGFEHNCALLSDRTVWCWGQNQRGQLGNGTNDDSFLPGKVQGLENVAQIQCGRDHSCARLEDGSILCWGSNEYGQLGDGSEEDSTTPVRVRGL